MARRTVSIQEIAQHNQPDDLWLVVDGVVYDMTEFAPRHPGGAAILHRYGGRDASRAYGAVHGASLIGASLAASQRVGDLDADSITPQWRSDATSDDADEADLGHPEARPPLDEIINLNDFEAAARASLPPKAWAYISTGSNDNVTRDLNAAILQRLWLRPAILRDVAVVDTATTLFGCPLSMPVLAAPTGATRLGGPDGELAVARGAGAAGIVPVISTVSSFPYEEILRGLPADGHAFFQLYVDKDKTRAARLLRDLIRSPRGRAVRAVFVTVDLPVISKREADERASARAARARGESARNSGVARTTGSFVDASFTWEHLRWLRATLDEASGFSAEHAKHAEHAEHAEPEPRQIAIVVKGIQRAEDARKALQMGCQGIVLTNHGGRSLDTVSPAIITLLELHKSCPEVFGRMEIIVDGGFRRGADVVKAICLGASAVGFGRPFVYSVGYGHEGVEHAAAIIKDEIVTAMQLCGLTNLMRDAHPNYVNTGDVDHLVPGLNHPYARKPVWPSRL